MKLIRAVSISLAVLALSACASFKKNDYDANRGVASVAQCPGASAAYEAKRLDFQNINNYYSNCQFGISGDCNNFCSAASNIGLGGGYVPTPDPIPQPIDVCEDSSVRNSDRGAVSSTQRINALGRDPEQCVENALSSDEAFALEDSCNAQVQCSRRKNCSAEKVGSADIRHVGKKAISLNADVDIKLCGDNKGGPGAVRCQELCADKLTGRDTGAHIRNEYLTPCFNDYGVECEVTNVGSNIIHSYAHKKHRCSVSADFGPRRPVTSCSVPVKADNKRDSYGGRRGGRGGRGGGDRNRDYRN